MRDVNVRFGIDVSYTQAWRGMCAAKEQLRGSPEESFAQLPFYLYNLQLVNPGTMYDIKTDSNECFESVFVAFGASIRGFIHLRPIIILDAAHLRGKFKCQNFLAVGMDGNNDIFILTIGVGKIEDGETWEWFLSNLKNCIGETPGMDVISDNHTSIKPAVARVFPSAYHGVCCRHLMVNLKLGSGVQGELNESLFWGACKAYRVAEFNIKFGELVSKVPHTRDPLIEAGFQNWSEAHYSGARYNIMTSNSAESINVLTKDARALPITQFKEFICSFCQRWFFERREYGENLAHQLTTYAEKKVNNRRSKCSSWTVRGINNFKFEVIDSISEGVVNFADRTCSCRIWQLSGLPFGHVIVVAVSQKNKNFGQWASEYFTTKVFQATYGESINPLPPFNEWCFPTDFINVQPHLMDKRPAGRPKNVVRIRSKDEVVSSTICSRCNHEGHNRSKCPQLAPSGCSKGKKYSIPKSQLNDASGSNNDAYHPFGTNQYYPFCNTRKF